MLWRDNGPWPTASSTMTADAEALLAQAAERYADARLALHDATAAAIREGVGQRRIRKVGKVGAVTVTRIRRESGMVGPRADLREATTRQAAEGLCLLPEGDCHIPMVGFAENAPAGQHGSRRLVKQTFRQIASRCRCH